MKIPPKLDLNYRYSLEVTTLWLLSFAIGTAAVQGETAPSVATHSLISNTSSAHSDPAAPHGEIVVQGEPVERGGVVYVAPETRFFARWTESASGIASWQATINQIAVRPEDWLGPWEPGAYTLDSSAIDHGGRTAETGPFEFEVDAEAPALSWEILSDRAVGCDGNEVFDGPVQIAVEAEDSQSGVDAIEWSTDGRVWTDVPEPFEVRTTDIDVRSRDAVGNLHQEHLSLAFDHEAPTIELRDPVGRLRNANERIELEVGEQLQLDAHDDSCAVRTLKISLDRSPWSDAPKALAFERPGKRTLWIAATDPFGKQTMERWRLRVRKPDNGRRSNAPRIQSSSRSN